MTSLNKLCDWGAKCRYQLVPNPRTKLKCSFVHLDIVTLYNEMNQLKARVETLEKSTLKCGGSGLMSRDIGVCMMDVTCDACGGSG